MADFQSGIDAFERAEWIAMLTSALILIPTGLLAAGIHRYLVRRRLKIAALAAVLFVYAAGSILYLHIFERRYVMTHTRLLETIPGPHGTADPSMARYMALVHIERLRDLPPSADFSAYPTWLVFAIPAATWVGHSVWLSRRTAG